MAGDGVKTSEFVRGQIVEAKPVIKITKEQENEKKDEQKS
jgi:hypothetical protein